MTEPEWRRLNRANWDERAKIHVGAPRHYNQSRLRSGSARFGTVTSDVLGPVDGQKILHLQCHFGMDSLIMAQQGAQVVGVDFSPVAIEAARKLAAELGLADRARFVESDVYDAPAAVGDPGGFDRVFVSWGALCWLPDVGAWAKVVAQALRPGGYLALAEAHPAAYVFDNRTATPDGMPGWYAPYLGREGIAEDGPTDYADPDARLVNSKTIQFLHPLSDVVMALIDAGLRLDRLTEHDSIVWEMFANLAGNDRDGYRWPDKPWLPLSYTIRASRPLTDPRPTGLP